jgi:hypothetical protein
MVTNGNQANQETTMNTAEETTTCVLDYGRGYSGKFGNKCWAARISGSNPKYKLEREFLEPELVEKAHFNRYRTMIHFTYRLEVDGLYELSEGGSRWFIAVYPHKDTGEITYGTISANRAQVWVEALDAGATDKEARTQSKGL